MPLLKILLIEVNDRGTDRAAMKKEKTKEDLESKLIHQKNRQKY